MNPPDLKRARLSLGNYLALAFAVCWCGVLSSRAQPQPVVATTMHSFSNNPDGATPYFSPSVGADGMVYGCTSFGGTNGVSGAGTIFKMNRDGTGYSILRNFFASENGSTFPTIPGPFVMRARDGAIYGCAQGGSESYPQGLLFKLNTDGSDFTVLHVFADNAVPTSVLLANNGALYGGGIGGVFKMDTDGNNYSLLHAFNTPVDGNGAYGKLIQGADGFLYGTTDAGGTHISGTIFKLDTNGTVFTVLHTFGATGDGAKPYSGLVQGDDGALYGTTINGGTNAGGIVYKLNPDGSGYQILHHFLTNGFDGLHPYSELTVGLNHILYGTTSAGGTNNGNGTVFEVTPDGGYQTVWSFKGPNGVQPFAGLVRGISSDDSGVLYGMCKAGGATWGTVYAMIVNAPLSITPAVTTSGSNPVVMWPAWALGYQLQTTTNLASGQWVTAASNGIPVAGLQLTNAPSGSYYRLIWNSTN